MTDHTPTFDEQLDKVLTKLENEVATDISRHMLQHSSGKSPKSSHYEARQSIIDLILTTHEAVQPKDLELATEPRVIYGSQMTVEEIESTLEYIKGFNAALASDTAALRAAIGGNNKEVQS